MSDNQLTHQNAHIPAASARVIKLAKDINRTRKTVAALKAGGHITNDAEKHLNEISADLNRLMKA